ncbi:N-acetylglutamate kinase [Pelagirhabdus alkalitolerans]|uniref:Acetylglutamate kinase n=1 Tax=Pelagirhabdus alkalitolerans TaxID=1612202 RepID=A0A1G6GK89_9BACI|nr:acetylglutamate kinase [Pelagirhabdus alkalitolerans]SDB82421.1 N-acetylglutamate kinase [Pelagirhabdus alkalitolerans]
MEYMVIKCGGSIVEKLPSAFYESFSSIIDKGIKPIIVHGGGPMISSQLDKLDVKTTFVDGLRVTTDQVLDVVEMVLSGSVNKTIVRKFLDQGVKAVGMSGIDGSMLEAEPVKDAGKIGHVGHVTHVNTKMIEALTDAEFLPIISPLGVGEAQQRYNVNADLAAASIAQALEAPLLYVSDIPGICVNDELIHFATEDTIKGYIEAGDIYGGMIPKVNSAIQALRSGVPEVAIVSGLDPDSVIDFTQHKKVGTTIQLKEASHVL